MFHMMYNNFLGVFFGSVVQTRFYGILGLAIVSLLPLSAAYAQNIIRLVGDEPGNVYGNSLQASVDVSDQNPNNNQLEIAFNVAGSAYGAYIDDDTDVMSNSVIMSDGTVGENVYGGYSISGNVTFNSVTLSGGTVEMNVYGGYMEDGDGNVMFNSVTLSGGTVLENVYGGYMEGGDVMNNTVTIVRGTIGNGGTGFFGNVFGGWSEHGRVTGNIVSISGGAILSNDGDSGNVYGGYSLENDATKNIVFIGGGEVIVEGMGGGNIYGGKSDNGNATGNSIMISGTPDLIKSNIYGGYSESGDATYNTVTLSGTPVLTNSEIFGGYGTGDVFSGNALNVHTGGHTVKSVQNFEYMNFFVPATMGGGTMLTATESVNIDGTIVNVGISGSVSPLQEGDHIVLIDVTDPGGLTGTTANDTANGRGMRGVTLLCEFDILKPGENPDQLWAVLTKTAVNPQTSALSEGFLTGTMLLNQTGERVTGNGLNGAVNAAWQNRNCGWGVFGDISGGWSQYNTGTNIHLDSLSVIGGVSRCMKTMSGRLTGGLFVEYGNGSYDAFTLFNDAASVKSNGKLDHVGGGALGRWEFGNSGYGMMSRLYLDGSFRVGVIHNKYDSDLRDMSGKAVSYTSGSAYCGAHIGAGKIWHFADHARFDLNGKYLWSQMQGDSLTLSTGDPMDFECVNSHRLRFGGRYLFAASHYVTPYLGGAWEHEFGGVARASTNGRAMIDSPSLRGDTGIGEVGIALRPATSRGFFIDLGVQCYAGKRDGVAAALHAGRKF